MFWYTASARNLRSLSTADQSERLAFLRCTLIIPVLPSVFLVLYARLIRKAVRHPRRGFPCTVDRKRMAHSKVELRGMPVRSLRVRFHFGPDPPHANVSPATSIE